jgi:nondiscriminating aspartyl-tRNA synthetase
MGFVQDHTTVMTVLREVVAAMVEGVREHAPDAASLLGLDLPIVPTEIPRIHFRDAQELVARATSDDVTGEPDLAPAHEAWLGDWATREHGSNFLFVTGYPMAKRPFYTHPDPDMPGFSNSFDLLFRGLELATGGQRLHLYEDYRAALSARNLDTGPFEAYLEAFRHGMPPHGGFAIGLERWILQLVGVANIREATLFPRDLNRLSP